MIISLDDQLDQLYQSTRRLQYDAVRKILAQIFATPLPETEAHAVADRVIGIYDGALPCTQRTFVRTIRRLARARINRHRSASQKVRRLSFVFSENHMRWGTLTPLFDTIPTPRADEHAS